MAIDKGSKERKGEERGREERRGGEDRDYKQVGEEESM